MIGQNILVNSSQTPIRVQNSEQNINAQIKLSSLTPGQTVNGQVISVSGSTVQISLWDNAVISASMKNNVMLTEGQSISFQVRSTDSGQITLSPLLENTSNQNSILAALNQAELPVTQSSLEMVQDMMQNNMPIDRASLIHMNYILSQNAGAAVGDLVSLTKLNIPVTEDNLMQFNAYSNYKHEIQGAVNAIISDLPEAYQSMVSSGDGSMALDIFGSISRLFCNPDILDQGGENILNEAGTNTQNSASLPSEAGALANASDTPTLAAGDGIAGKTENAMASSAEAGMQQLEDSATGSFAASAELKADISAQIIKSQTDTLLNMLNADPEQDSTIALQNSTADSKALLDAVNGNLGQLSDADADNLVQGLLSPNEQALILDSNSNSKSNSIISLFEQLTGNKDAFNQFLSLNGKAVQEIIKQFGNSDLLSDTEKMQLISKLFDSTAHSSVETDKIWNKVFSSNQYNQIMKNCIEQNWMLKPEDTDSKDNVDNLYKRLFSQTRDLSQILSAAAGTKAAQGSTMLMSNLEFMNQLNQTFSYIQLPLKMTDQNANGDLYVYTNRKNLSGKDGEVSCVMHLDMTHLGTVDVYVRMKDMKVNTDFCLADEASIDLIADHIDELTANMQKRGYDIKAKIMQKDEKSSDNPAIDEILENGSRVNLVAENSFDARA